MSDRKFIRAEKGKYSLEEEQFLGKLCKRGRSMMQKLKSFLKNWTSMIKWRNTHKKHYVKNMLLMLFESSIQTWKKLNTMTSIFSQSLFLVKDVMSSW